MAPGRFTFDSLPDATNPTANQSQQYPYSELASLLGADDPTNTKSTVTETGPGNRFSPRINDFGPRRERSNGNGSPEKTLVHELENFPFLSPVLPNDEFLWEPENRALAISALSQALDPNSSLFCEHSLLRHGRDAVVAIGMMRDALIRWDDYGPCIDFYRSHGNWVWDMTVSEEPISGLYPSSYAEHIKLMMGRNINWESLQVDDIGGMMLALAMSGYPEKYLDIGSDNILSGMIELTGNKSFLPTYYELFELFRSSDVHTDVWPFNLEVYQVGLDMLAARGIIEVASEKEVDMTLFRFPRVVFTNARRALKDFGLTCPRSCSNHASLCLASAYMTDYLSVDRRVYTKGNPPIKCCEVECVLQDICELEIGD